MLPGVVALSNYHVAHAVCMPHSRGRGEGIQLRHRHSKFSYLVGEGGWSKGVRGHGVRQLARDTCSVALLNKVTNCVRCCSRCVACGMQHVASSIKCAACGMLSVNNSRQTKADGGRWRPAAFTPQRNEMKTVPNAKRNHNQQQLQLQRQRQTRRRG